MRDFALHRRQALIRQAQGTVCAPSSCWPPTSAEPARDSDRTENSTRHALDPGHHAGQAERPQGIDGRVGAVPVQRTARLLHGMHLCLVSVAGLVPLALLRDLAELPPPAVRTWEALHGIEAGGIQIKVWSSSHRCIGQGFRELCGPASIGCRILIKVLDCHTAVSHKASSSSVRL